MKNYIIKVNESEIEVDNATFDALDMEQRHSTSYHVLKDDIAYDVQLLQSDFESRTLKLYVNGNLYTVAIKDSYDQLVDQMGLLSNATQKAQNIKAPMPGLIMDILVQAGQEIQEGTPLLVLSAMKMENQILAQGAGTIKSIEVKVGDTVDKGQLIIEMEEWKDMLVEAERSRSQTVGFFKMID